MVLQYMLEMGGELGRTTSATYDYVTDLISNKQKVSGAQVDL